MEAKKVLAAARGDFKDAESEREQEEAILMAAISAEVDPNTGKAAFSNDKARQAELIVRKKLSPEYQEVEAAVTEAEREVNSAQFELERLQDEYKSYRYVADLTARELALYSDAGNGGSEKQAY